MKAAAQAGKEKISTPVFSLAASAAAAAATKSEGTNPIPQPDTQAETRIRVFNFAGTTRISPTTWLSSTSQWASTHSSGRTVPVSIVQRYYANNFGRFMSPDPYVASAGPNDPESWNRYAYTRGDPTNRLDFTGLSDTCPDCLDSVTVYAFRDSGGSGIGSAQGTDWPWVAMNFADTKGQLLPTLQGATAQQQKDFTSALKDALSRLKKKKKCADDLGGDATTTLLNANFTVGLPMRYDTQGNPVAAYDPGIYAATNVAMQTVTINLLGHFFNFYGTSPTGQKGAYNMNTGLGKIDFDAFVLLHELGHLNGVLGDDNKDPKLSDQFNEEILKDCFGVNWTPPSQ